MIERSLTFCLKYCETPTIMVLVENGQAVPKKGKQYWRYTHLSLNHHCIWDEWYTFPTHPPTPKKQLFPKKVSTSWFLASYFLTTKHDERKFLFFTQAPSTCVLIRPGKVGNTPIQSQSEVWRPDVFLFSELWKKHITIRDNYLDKNSQFFSGCCKIYGIGCFLDFICIPMYVSLSNNPKKRLIFLLKPPPQKNKDH